MRVKLERGGAVNLVYLSKNTTGGWVTFTSHLLRVLTAAGLRPQILKRGNSTERFRRNFGYGLMYRNVSEADLISVTRKIPTIIVAIQKNFTEIAQDLLDAGAHMVVHDPAENSSRLDFKHSPWVVRRSGKKLITGSTFIPHPYVARTQTIGLDKREMACVSVSRIDFDKNTHILLDANRLGAGIKIFGFENRLYTKFTIMPKYPEWRQSEVAYPREHGKAYEILRRSFSMADMSLIKGDGGGTQYTTLEAWDALTVPIVHAGWILPKDEMVPGENCLVAEDGKSLRDTVRGILHSAATRRKLVAGGFESMQAHSAKATAPKIIKWIREG